MHTLAEMSWYLLTNKTFVYINMYACLEKFSGGGSKLFFVHKTEYFVRGSFTTSIHFSLLFVSYILIHEKKREKYQINLHTYTARLTNIHTHIDFFISMEKNIRFRARDDFSSFFFLRTFILCKKNTHKISIKQSHHPEE